MRSVAKRESPVARKGRLVSGDMTRSIYYIRARGAASFLIYGGAVGALGPE